MDPFTGEIRIFGFDFAPLSWAFCDGTQVPLQQYPALSSIIGSIYGGDGRTYFTLPNLKGRVGMGAGHGPGLTPRSVGQTGGTAEVTISQTQAPRHNHSLMAVDAPASVGSPDNNQFPAQGRNPNTFQKARNLYGPATNMTIMATDMLSPFAGQGGAHTNMQPYLGLNFCICLEGAMYPIRQ